MMANGFKATVTSVKERQSISRVSYHPENAYKNVIDWVQKQIDFAEPRGIEITWEIVAVSGKSITKFGDR